MSLFLCVFGIWSAAIYRRFCFSLVFLSGRGAIIPRYWREAHCGKMKNRQNKSGDKSPHSK
jgi:hypothetical protein